MPLALGALLNGRYRITGILGQGGMGAVYLASDESLSVPCAVKENLNLSAEAERMFRREASLLATLRHPNLPRVTDHFVLAGEQYLVMDYIEGQDLRQRLHLSTPLPEPLVLDWAVQLCDALIYLHSRTPPVVHRDIKPANIKLTPSGEVTLVDFGVAKHTTNDQKTATDTMAFTPGYTPPEQYGLARTDARADQYALAATLFTLLTGQSPPDSVELLLGNAVLTPLMVLRPDLSASTAAALTRALGLKPEHRFNDVSAFKAALQGATAPPNTRPAAAAAAAETLLPGRRAGPPAGAGRPPGARPPSAARPPLAAPLVAEPPLAAAPARHWTRSFWLAGIGCVVVVLAGLALFGGGVLGLMLGRASPTPTRTAAAVFTATPPSAATEPAASATQAPSDTQPPAATTAAPASPTGTAPAPVVTPTLPAATETAPPPGTPAGGPGRIAFLSDRAGGIFQIFSMNSDGSDVQQVTKDPSNKWNPGWPFSGTQLAWSPDGSQLLYVAESAAGDGTDLFLVNADGSQPQDLTNAAGDDFQPAWCADGTIWFASTRISNGVHQIFYTTLKDIAAGTRPVNFSATHNSPREYDPELYPGCQRLLFVTTLDGPPEIWRYWLDCPDCYRPVRSAKDLGGQAEQPALSPDGQYLAYMQTLSHASEIFVGALDDRTINVQLTSSKTNSEPQWSPDGQWLVFVSSRDGSREIYRMTLAGTSQTNLSNDPATDTDPVWQPGQ